MIDYTTAAVRKERDGRLKARKELIAECKRHTNTIHKDVEQNQRMKRRALQRVRKARIKLAKLDEQYKVSSDLESSNQKSSLASQIQQQRQLLGKQTDRYWRFIDEKAKSREVLKETVWLMCYGFKSLRSEALCGKLRREPDYSEPYPAGVNPIMVRKGSQYRKNAKRTAQFAQFMAATWKATKLMDKKAQENVGSIFPVNPDPSGIKGFTGLRPPLELAQLDAKAEPKPETKAAAEQAAGADLAKLSSEGLASKMSLLLQQANTVSAEVASPIRGVLLAIQTGAMAGSGTATVMLKTVLELDQTLGQDVATKDAEWASHIKQGRRTLLALNRLMQREARSQTTLKMLSRRQKLRISRAYRSARDSDHDLKGALEEKRSRRKDCDAQLGILESLLLQYRGELDNARRVNSLMRVLVLGEEPKHCPTDPITRKPCGGRSFGWCSWNVRGPLDPSYKPGTAKKATCVCKPGLYGPRCQYGKCPGKVAMLGFSYTPRMSGVCNNAGKECNGRGCHDSGCDIQTGRCQKCSAGRYHGPRNACEHRYCPAKAVRRPGDKVIVATSRKQQRSCPGRCVPTTGRCRCDSITWGPTCSWRKCPMVEPLSDKVVYHQKSSDYRVCNKRGTCDDTTGSCSCTPPYRGRSCELKGAPSSEAAALVVPRGGFNCPGLLVGSDTRGGNYCDRNSGIWTCLKGSGPDCEPPLRRQVELVDWSVSMDKWGWSLCPTGSLLFALRRSKEPVSTGKVGGSSLGTGDALYSLDGAKCAKPSVGGHSIPVEDCYHQNWWGTMDSAGGAFCRRNYFVAGLFRSNCNSLYCMEMAKCCRVRRAVWQNCRWSSTSAWGNAGKWAQLERGGSFVAGFYRTPLQTLNGLTKFRECDPIQWGGFGVKTWAGSAPKPTGAF